MAKKSRRNGRKRVKRMSGIAVAMRKRHPRGGRMVSPNKRRGKDTRNSWRNEEWA